MLLTPRSIETAKQYLAEKQVPQLMESLTSDLIEHKPEDPLEYVVRWSQSHHSQRAHPPSSGSGSGGGKPKLYLFSVSVNCLSAAVLLNEAGIEFERLELEVGKHRTPELLAINPQGSVPAFRDGDVTLYESQTILRYIANKWPAAGGRFYPVEAGQRAVVERAMDWRQTVLYPAIQLAAYPLLGFNDSTETLAAGKQKLEQALEYLAKHLITPGGFVSGKDTVSIADISIGTSLEFLDVVPLLKVPQEVTDYRERFARRCPTAEKNLAAPRGYIASIKGKFLEQARQPFRFYQLAVSVNCLHVQAFIRDATATAATAAGHPGLEVVNLNLGTDVGGTKHPDFLKINPRGLTPTLVDGPTVVQESQTILRYVANRLGLGAPWYPPQPAERARVEAAMDWRQTEFYVHVSKLCYPVLGFGLPAPSEEERKKLMGQLHADCEYLTTHLVRHGGFIGGEHACVADYSVCGVFEFTDVLSDFDPPAATKEYRKRWIAQSKSYTEVFQVLHSYVPTKRT